MESQSVLFIFIGLTIFNFLFTTVLEYLNDKNWKESIPKDLEGFYDSNKYQKAKNYKIERGKISLLNSSISFVITLLMLFFFGFGLISEYAVSFSDSIIVQSCIFFMIFHLLTTFLGMPFSYYSTFFIEEKYGFNKTTLKTFIVDKIKGLFISSLFIIVLTSLAIVLIEYFSTGFWIWLWIGLSSFMVFLNMFYADLIVPVFNKLTPLENGELRSKIESYSKKVGYSLKNIFVIDGSKRSTKANAFFSGLGPRKTIALYDTLIEKHTDEELVSVLAHEVGHFKKKHILVSMFLTILQLGIMCYLFELCMNMEVIASSLGSSKMNFHIGIIAFSFLYSPIGLITGILMNILSRKNEYEADKFAKDTYNGNFLELALKKLSVDSLSNLFPHPLYVFVHYSHPPLLKRLDRLKD
ncbi:MAG: M48 family metallopeptidase [Flavobacteriaceae bacterium]|nr:M48 family metallopeptidase [Flavobacteriaceae bacterium]